MFDTKETLHCESFILPRNEPLGVDLFAAIREGLSPFKAEQIEVYMEYDIDFHRYRVVADVRVKGGFRLCNFEYVDAWDLAANPAVEMAAIATLMLHAIRDREDTALSWNIHLGEN